MSQTFPSPRISPDSAENEALSAKPSLPLGWKAQFVRELSETVRNDRWSTVLYSIAGIHLLAFLITQWMYDPARDSDPRLLGVWIVELLAIWAALRAITGCWGYRLDTAPGVVLRVWVTFFILDFNSVLMNAQSGWAIHWYRLAWPTLSTFGFATLAWLVNVRFLIPAVQMWVTGLILVRFPTWSYAVYGVSWTAALVGTAWWIDRDRQTGQKAAAPRGSPLGG